MGRLEIHVPLSGATPRCQQLTDRAEGIPGKCVCIRSLPCQFGYNAAWQPCIRRGICPYTAISCGRHRTASQYVIFAMFHSHSACEGTGTLLTMGSLVFVQGVEAGGAKRCWRSGGSCGKQGIRLTLRSDAHACSVLTSPLRPSLRSPRALSLHWQRFPIPTAGETYIPVSRDA